MAPAVSWKSRSCCRKRMAWWREQTPQEGQGRPKAMASHTHPIQPAGQVFTVPRATGNFKCYLCPLAAREALCAAEANPLPPMPAHEGQELCLGRLVPSAVPEPSPSALGPPRQCLTGPTLLVSSCTVPSLGMLYSLSGSFCGEEKRTPSESQKGLPPVALAHPEP